MANITSAQAGNWNQTATWTGGVVPGNGDTAVVNHAISVTANQIIGTSPIPRATVLTITATLTVATDIDFTVRGEILINGNINLVLSDGARLLMDAASTGEIYRVQIGAANNQNAKVVANGTSGNRCEVSNINGEAEFVSGGFTSCGKVDLNFCDVTLRQIQSVGGSSGGFVQKIKSCILTLTNGFTISSSMSGNSAFEVENSTFAGAVVTNAINIVITGGGTGNRWLRGVVVKAGMVNFANGVHDVRFDDGSVFMGGVTLGGSTKITDFSECLITRGTSSSDPVTTAHDMTDCAIIHNGPTNPHFFTPSGQFATNFIGLVFEYLGTDNNGDCILQPAPSVLRTITVTGCIVLPSAGAGSSGALCNHLQAGNNNVLWRVQRNTVAVGNSNALGAMMFEVAGGASGLVDYVKDNLCVSDSVNGRIVAANGLNLIDDAITAADHNSIWNLTLDAAVTDPYEPADADFGVTPGTGDVYANPSFTGNFYSCGLAAWDSSLGGAGTAANALTELQKRNDVSGFNSAYTPINFISFVRAAATPTNLALKGAASDGGDIGAVPVGGLPVGNGPRSMHLLRQKKKAG